MLSICFYRVEHISDILAAASATAPTDTVLTAEGVEITPVPPTICAARGGWRGDRVCVRGWRGDRVCVRGSGEYGAVSWLYNSGLFHVLRKGYKQMNKYTKLDSGSPSECTLVSVRK